MVRPNTGPIRLVIFDCDGTLVDSQHSIISAMEYAWRAHDLEGPTADAVRRVVGLPLETAIANILPDSADHGALVPGLTEAYKAEFARQRGNPDYEEPLFPDTRKTIEALLESDFLLAGATGKSRRGALATLGQHDLLKHFIAIKTADDGPGKPDPYMVEQAMLEAGTSADETVVVGDTTFDMLMARNAGTRAIGVSWGYHPPEELHAVGAQHVIDTFGQLPGLVRLQTNGA